jgi:hypothetical protein
LNSYVSYADKDCRWGIQSVATDILDSGEAVSVWHDNPQTLAGMLYAALLNRPPDAGGLATYTAAIQQNGLRWAITSMLASGEYQSRLGKICAGRASTNATAWDSEDGAAQAILINNGASELVKACAAALLINTFAPIKAGLFKDAGVLIKASRVAAGKVAKLSGSCNAAWKHCKPPMLLPARPATRERIIRSSWKRTAPRTGISSATGAPPTSGSGRAPSSGLVIPRPTAACSRSPRAAR